MQESSAPAKRRLQGVLNAALLTGAVFATVTAVAVVIGLFWWLSSLPSASSPAPLAAPAQKPQRPLSAAAPPSEAGEPAGEAAAPPSGAGAAPGNVAAPQRRVGAPPSRASAPPAAEAAPPVAEAAPPAASGAPPAAVPTSRFGAGHRLPSSAPPPGQVPRGAPPGNDQ